MQSLKQGQQGAFDQKLMIAVSFVPKGSLHIISWRSSIVHPLDGLA